MGFIGIGIMWAIMNTFPIITQIPTTTIDATSQLQGPDFTVKVKKHILICKAKKKVKFQISDGFLVYRRQISHRLPKGFYMVMATDLDTNAETNKIIEIK